MMGLQYPLKSCGRHNLCTIASRPLAVGIYDAQCAESIHWRSVREATRPGWKDGGSDADGNMACKWPPQGDP